MAWTPIALTLPQYVDPDGIPFGGSVLKAYVRGTSTPTPWATDVSGSVLVDSMALNINGYPEVSGGEVIPHIDQDYKIVLYPDQAAADADTGAIWSIDNLALEQITAQYVDSGVVPTFAGTDSFTLAGDQTSEFHVGRRVSTVDAGGVDYGTITASAFVVDTTTVTVAIDSSGEFDAGLSSAQLSILRADDTSAVPAAQISGLDWTLAGDLSMAGTLFTVYGTSVPSAATLALGDGNAFDVTGTTTIDAIASKGAGTHVVLTFQDALTLTHSASLELPTGADLTTEAGDVAHLLEFDSGWRVTSYERFSGRAIIGGWEKISETTFAGAATYEVPLDAAYRQYHIILEMVSPSATAELQATVSDGAYKAADYWYGLIEQAAGVLTGLSAATGPVVRLTDAQISTGAGNEVFADIWITGHQNAAGQAQIRSEVGHNGGGTIYQWRGHGRYGVDAAISELRLALSTGNFASGTATVYGLRAA